MTGHILLGTQSWSYRSWLGPFYPSGAKPDDMLSFYSRIFPTVEVDSTFYGIPPEPVVLSWRDGVPPEFQFALKVPQQITHEARLVDTEQPMKRFLQRVTLLEGNLGPLLVQMSPDFLPSDENRAVLHTFLPTLAPELRWAIEFRHVSWLCAEIVEGLRGHGVALALADGRWLRQARLLQLIQEPTAPFLYIRWMGQGRHLTDFSRPQIDRGEDRSSWAHALKSASQRVDTIYGYFNNQFEGHGPYSTLEMQRLLGIDTVEPAPLHPQGDLFG